MGQYIGQKWTVDWSAKDSRLAREWAVDLPEIDNI